MLRNSESEPEASFPQELMAAWSEPSGMSRGSCSLCYAIVLPVQKSGFRAGCRPDSCRGNLKIGPPAGLRPAGKRNPARKPDFWPGSTIA
jgi:hypothetical protein